MAQQYNNNFQKSKYNKTGNHNNNNYYNKEQEPPFFKNIEKPLHVHYSNEQDLYLPKGIAYNIAERFKNVSSSQLRKILEQSKICKYEMEKSNYDFNKIINRMYALLPMAAYNAGRDKSLKDLYEFLRIHISKKTITCNEDILVFDKLFTSIIAYHKFQGGK